MKKAHFGTKLCIDHEKTVSVYQRNTIVTAFFMYSAHCLVSPLPTNARPEVEHEKTLNNNL
jgi:hypothetical protein